MPVYRVYTGWMSACPEHVIVLADSGDEALDKFRRAGHQNDGASAEEIVMNHEGVELQIYTG